jgi:GntR family transcriptional repressor for pyruvate dehydrogenase complex
MSSDLPVKFTPIGTKRVLETVVAALEEPILQGAYKDGDMLPPEVQLAAQLGVGRRAVREALKVLETKGLVQVQMGVGTIVRRNDLDSFLDTLSENVRSYLYVNKAQAKHVMELRLLIEGAALERLAHDPDPARIQRLREAVEQQTRAVDAEDYQTYQEWHIAFHGGIVDILDNPVISMLYRQVMALVRAPMERAGARVVRHSNTIRQHSQILDEAEHGHVAEMRVLLERHLQNFFRNMQDQEDGLDGGQPVAEPAAPAVASTETGAP